MYIILYICIYVIYIYCIYYMQIYYIIYIYLYKNIETLVAGQTLLPLWLLNLWSCTKAWSSFVKLEWHLKFDWNILRLFSLSTLLTVLLSDYYAAGTWQICRGQAKEGANYAGPWREEGTGSKDRWGRPGRSKDGEMASEPIVILLYAYTWRNEIAFCQPSRYGNLTHHRARRIHFSSRLNSGPPKQKRCRPGPGGEVKNFRYGDFLSHAGHARIIQVMNDHPGHEWPSRSWMTIQVMNDHPCWLG